MKKQALMGVLMTTLLVSVTVAAQAQTSGRVVADIPFNFQIGDKSLPAGEYIVDAVNSDGALLRIMGKDGGKAQVALTNAASGKQLNRSRMVFHKYGDQYFLKAVWNAGREGRALIESGRERKLRRELNGMAKLAGRKTVEPEIVIVAAR
jgi:hypothetical protein